MSALLKNKVALITGAGAGIGAAVAKRFAAEGATLWLNDLDPSTLDAIIAETGGSGLAGDMSDSNFATDWVNQAATQHGRIDVLYNNVGVSHEQDSSAISVTTTGAFSSDYPSTPPSSQPAQCSAIWCVNAAAASCRCRPAPLSAGNTDSVDTPQPKQASSR